MSIPARWIGCAGGILLAVSLAYGQKPESEETLLQAAIKKEVVDGDLKGAAEWKLWVATLADGNLQEVKTGLTARITMRDWSPDGEKIAFTGVTGGEEEFWLMENFLR